MMRAFDSTPAQRTAAGRWQPSVALCDRAELFAIWSVARAEANIAYDDWRTYPSREAYLAYRAAEDRADAAQDALAHLVKIAA